MILEVAPHPTQRRRATHLYLDTLATLAMKAYPPLRTFGSPTRMMMLKPILELQEALLQASNREVPKLFEDVFKNTRCGRPPASRRDQLCWATASAVITILMQDYGKTEDEAARLVEAHLRKQGFRLTTIVRADVAPAWKRLQAWRDKCMAGQKGKLAARYYRDAMRYMGEPGEFPILTVQECLEFLLSPPFSTYEPEP